MRYTELRLNGQPFSMPAITLGTVMFGSRVPEAEAFKAMDAYLAAGGNWIDTARVYCTDLIPQEQRAPGFMDSEECIGRWVRDRGVRDRVTLITKGAHWSLATREKRVNAACIRADVETSLKKLGVDQIDLYLLHRDDPDVPAEEIMPALDELVRQGKIRVPGVSNWRTDRIREANAFAEKNGLTPFAISQVSWSYAAPAAPSAPDMVNMWAEPEEYAGYQKLNMPVMAYSSQAGGFFIKAGKNGLTPEGLGGAAKRLTPENERRARAAMELARQAGVTVAAAAFGYLWSRKIPVTALVGPSTAAHLADSLIGCDFTPTPEQVKLLEAAL